MKKSMIIHPEELSRRWIDRLADSGVEILGIHPHGGSNAKDSLAELVELMRTDEYRALIDYARSRGIEIEYEIHAGGYLLPRELFAEHPEYFRMNDRGERTSDYNLCVSNPDALAILAKRARDLTGELYGTCNRFYLWLDDNKNSVCHCPRCQSLTPSDQLMIATNAMIREIRRDIPDASIAYLSYLNTLEPPMNVERGDGVFLEYAPIEKYLVRGDDAEERILRERAALARVMDYFSDTPKKLLEYWYDNSLFSRWKKPAQKFTLDAFTMAEDEKYYIPLGFDYVSTFACFLGEDYEALHGGFDITPFARFGADDKSAMN